MHGEYRGVFGGLKRSANDLAARLAEFAGRLGSSTNVVRSASAEISDGAEDLARRTESQAGTLEETAARSEEHTSELQSLMRISYAVFCLKKKNKRTR